VLAFAAWGLFILATGPWENQTVAEARGDDWLRPLAVVLILSALVAFAGVMTARAWLVAPAFAIQAVIAVPVLIYVRRHWSDHADGQLIVYSLAFEVTGLLAVLLTVRAGREPMDTQSGRP
jgi:O-antigen/teichoic acid export membrane protein